MIVCAWDPPFSLSRLTHNCRNEHLRNAGPGQYDGIEGGIIQSEDRAQRLGSGACLGQGGQCGSTAYLRISPSLHDWGLAVQHVGRRGVDVGAPSVKLLRGERREGGT